METSTPDRLLNLLEYEAAAQQRLSPMVWQYVAGGSDDAVTVHANRAAFARWRLLPRMLCGVQTVSTTASILGQAIALPVLVAPTGRHRLCHAEGERATARAAKAAGTIYVMSTAATMTVEAIGPVAGPWWFQLFLYRDRERTRELVQRAAAAGASALVLTVDAPVRGRREGEERLSFTMPADIPAALMTAPAAADRQASPPGSAVGRDVDAIFDPALTWDDLDWLASLSSLPILVKGILHPDDAVRALDHGVQGIVVSNHGGRQLDNAVSALDALPAVVQAVRDRTVVLMDGGVRRGTDVLKALAFGASAVLIGRPIYWGLAVDGEAGVTQVLALLQAELTRDLWLSGLRSPAEVTRSLIVPADTPVSWPSASVLPA